MKHRARANQNTKGVSEKRRKRDGGSTLIEISTAVDTKKESPEFDIYDRNIVSSSESDSPDTVCWSDFETTNSGIDPVRVGITTAINEKIA